MLFSENLYSNNPSNVSVRLRLGIHKGMKWNDHKGIERNGMYLSKEKEWNGMKLSNLD